jgi:P27 family predicted phage terminase small subunit
VITGRPKTPAAVKRLRGTYRPDRDAKGPLPGAGAPRLRPGLPAAVAHTARGLVRLLRSWRVLTPGDVHVVELTAAALVEYDVLSATLLETGMTTERITQTGGTVYGIRPEVSARADAWRRALGGLQQLGMTPACRTKVTVLSTDERDPLERFLEAD